MKIGFWNYYSSLNAGMFVERNAPIGDDLLLPLIRVKEEAARCGVEVVAMDRENWPSLDAIVFIDYPDDRDPVVRLALDSRTPKYLIALENAIIRPENYREWSRFRKVLTWHDGLVEWAPKRCVKINYAQEFNPVSGNHQRFCCMIASNKTSEHPESLYGERVRAIRWFEAENSLLLDLWGPGWSSGCSYHGTIPAGLKRSTLANYAFSIVFENAREVGYITEKIFDCFIAGVIPVYLGAPNVGQYIPSECFIDARRFLTTSGSIDYRVLYNRIATMPAGARNSYREAIQRFISGPEAAPFATSTFARTVLDTVAGARG